MEEQNDEICKWHKIAIELDSSTYYCVQKCNGQNKQCVEYSLYTGDGDSLQQLNDSFDLERIENRLTRKPSLIKRILFYKLWED